MSSIHDLTDGSSAPGRAPSSDSSAATHQLLATSPHAHHQTLPSPASIAAQAQAHANAPPLSPISSPALVSSGPLPIPRPDESPLFRHATPIPPAHLLHSVSPPLRKDTSSSISTQATTATLASTETNNTSYSAEASPNLHQSIFSVKDGSDVSNTRRTSRRRTGPLSQQSRERAALIRKLGACNDCRRRRVACHPSHHNMTWEDVVSKFHRSQSPTIQDIAPSLAAGRPMSPGSSSLSNVQPVFTHDPQEMDVDSTSPPPHQPGRPPLSEARLRTPLPSGPGPRLEKSLSLPGIESLKNDLQNNISRMLSTSSRTRYTTVNALLLFWQEDDEIGAVQDAVSELAGVFDSYYHYTFQVKPIPSSSESCKSPWKWLSRQLYEFAEDRDQRDVLKIVYYVGHTYLDGNRDMILASSRDMSKASTVRWSGIETILEAASADTLIIMDAAYYPSSRMVRQQGVLELIAASVSEEHFNALDRCAFTKALAEQLRMRATRLIPLSAVELHSLLLAHYPKMIQDRYPEKETITSFPAPLHAMTSGNSRLPSIFLSPIFHNSPLRNSFAYENNPQLHLAIRLHDDNVDVDSWNEWMRLMPDGIKDVKVEGPFRPTFR